MIDVLSTSLHVLVRHAKCTDQSYVAKTFVDSLMKADPNTKRSDLNNLVDRVLDNPNVRITLAVEPTKPDVILGWLAHAPMGKLRIVVYVYVRNHQRLRGVARHLIESVWPGSNGALMWCLSGPSSKQLLDRNPNAVHLDIEELLA